MTGYFFQLLKLKLMGKIQNPLGGTRLILIVVNRKADRALTFQWSMVARRLSKILERIMPIPLEMPFWSIFFKKLRGPNIGEVNG